MRAMASPCIYHCPPLGSLGQAKISVLCYCWYQCSSAVCYVDCNNIYSNILSHRWTIWQSAVLRPSHQPESTISPTGQLRQRSTSLLGLLGVQVSHDLPDVEQRQIRNPGIDKGPKCLWDKLHISFADGCLLMPSAPFQAGSKMLF